MTMWVVVISEMAQLDRNQIPRLPQMCYIIICLPIFISSQLQPLRQSLATFQIRQILLFTDHFDFAAQTNHHAGGPVFDELQPLGVVVRADR